MKDFAVFWGCTIQARFPFLEKSSRLVFEAFKLPYRDVNGFTCCPEKSLINNVDAEAFTVTAARNVSVVDGLGVDLVSPCTGCVSNLATVKEDLLHNPGEKTAVNKLLKEVDKEFTGEASLFHLVPFFHDHVGKNIIQRKIKKTFAGMKVAIHYGCHMIRPSHALKNDDPLDPVKFDDLVRWLGAESLGHRTKMMCCGQGLDRVDQHENALHLAREKLVELKKIGADAMVVCCPSCFQQFDNNQYLMIREGERIYTPVIYFTELLGLALGMTPEELGMGGHRVDVTPFIDKWKDQLDKAGPSEVIDDELNEPGALA
ncbi:MAG: CoB--CoM heterodisulfide reductase iron-sulfur subunit B family protein [Thermodesulfobacteriota bacterium]